MSAVRYKLCADAFFVQDRDGVLLRNDRGSLSLAGKGAYALIKQLFGALEEGATLEDVVAGLTSERRASLEALLGRLAQHGFVRLKRAPAELIPEWTSTNYCDLLRFLEDQTDEPFARFCAFRELRVVCFGEPTSLRAVLGALVEYGAAQIVVVVPPGPDCEELALFADALEQRDLGASVRVVSEYADDARRDCTIVTEPAQLAERQSRPGGASGLSLLLHSTEDALIVTPPLGEAAFCEECLLRSLPPGAKPSGVRVPPAAASIAANQLVYGLFLQVALPELPREPALRNVNVKTLSTAAHRLLAHVRCSKHGGRPTVRALTPVQSGCAVRPDLPSGSDDAELIRSQDQRAQIIGGWCNRVTGPLLEVAEGELEQLPLASSECRLVDSQRWSDAPVQRRVVCRGFNARETRTQAVLYALEWLAPRLVADRPALIGLGLGVGFSEDEAAFRALYHATLKAGSEGCTSLHCDRPFEADERTRYLLQMMRERGGAPVRLRHGLSHTGLWFATVTNREDRTASGAGITPIAAQLNALLGLGVLMLPPEPASAAISACDMTTWAEALNAAAERRTRALHWQALDRVFAPDFKPLHTVTVTGEAARGAS